MTRHAAPGVTCTCGASITQGAWGDDWRALDGERPGGWWCPDGSLHEPAPAPERRLTLNRDQQASVLLWLGCLCLGFGISALRSHAPLWQGPPALAAAVALMSPEFTLLVRSAKRLRQLSRELTICPACQGTATNHNPGCTLAGGRRTR
jgi:hypothetical protein